MVRALERTHAFDDRPLRPPEVEYPYPREQLGHSRNGLGAWSEYLALRAVQETLGRLPDPLFRPLAAGGARLARLLDRGRTRSAREFVRAALPHLDAAAADRLVLAAWRHLLRLTVTFDRMHDVMLRHRLGDHYDVEICEGFEDLQQSGRGVIFVTAHVGQWEAVGAPLNALGFSPLYCIGKPPRNHPLARYVQRTRERAGGIMLPRNGAMKGVPAVVRAGGGVIMLLDQRARKKPIYADFFGRPAACDRSVGVLLRRVGAPIVFVACYGTDTPLRFQLRFTSVVHPEELSGQAPEAIVARVNRELEALILQAPDQYFWLHDRYKGAPPPPDPAARDEPTEGPDGGSSSSPEPAITR